MTAFEIISARTVIFSDQRHSVEAMIASIEAQHPDWTPEQIAFEAECRLGVHDVDAETFDYD